MMLAAPAKRKHDTQVGPADALDRTCGGCYFTKSAQAFYPGVDSTDCIACVKEKMKEKRADFARARQPGSGSSPHQPSVIIVAICTGLAHAPPAAMKVTEEEERAPLSPEQKEPLVEAKEDVTAPAGAAAAVASEAKEDDDEDFGSDEEDKASPSPEQQLLPTVEAKEDVAAPAAAAAAGAQPPTQYKQCRECKGDPKPASAFYKDKTNSDGLRGACKECAKKQMRAYMRTPVGFLLNLQRNCYKGAARLRKEGKHAPYDLPDRHTEQLWEDLVSLCKYTDMPLASQPGSSWQASLEAMDQALGHVVGNVTLIILELNHQLGWSPARIVEHLQLRHEPTSAQAIVDQIMTVPEIKRPEPATERKNPTTGLMEYECHGCRVFKLLDDMNSVTQCQLCHNAAQRATPHARATALISRANSSTRARNEKPHRANAQHVNDITLADVCVIIMRQGNRCYHSGQPIDWSPGATPWAPSFERLNVFLGYTAANTVIVCAAFNAMDCSSVTKHPGVGKHGWTPEKYAQFFAAVTHKYRVQLRPADMVFKVT